MIPQQQIQKCEQIIWENFERLQEQVTGQLKIQKDLFASQYESFKHAMLDHFSGMSQQLESHREHVDRQLAEQAQLLQSQLDTIKSNPCKFSFSNVLESLQNSDSRGMCSQQAQSSHEKLSEDPAAILPSIREERAPLNDREPLKDRDISTDDSEERAPLNDREPLKDRDIATDDSDDEPPPLIDVESGTLIHEDAAVNEPLCVQGASQLQLGDRDEACDRAVEQSCRGIGQEGGARSSSAQEGAARSSSGENWSAGSTRFQQLAEEKEADEHLDEIYQEASTEDKAVKIPTLLNFRSRIAIVIPFRAQEEQDRERQLHDWKWHFEYSSAENCINAEFLVVVAEQTKDGRKFNRGQLLNAGYLWALEHVAPVDSVIFHDCDLLPPPGIMHMYSTPARKSEPVGIMAPHLCASYKYSSNDWRPEGYPPFFGAVTALHPEDFKQCNGFPNDIWGWGCEDDHLYLRLQAAGCMEHGVLQSPVGTDVGQFVDLDEVDVYDWSNDPSWRAETYHLINTVGWVDWNDGQTSLDLGNWKQNGLSTLKYMPRESKTISVGPRKVKMLRVMIELGSA